MAIQTKKSVMAIVEEVTEALPVAPSSTSYVALQDGFSLEPAFESLENAELTGSIGIAAPIQGFEQPSSSLSHYIRHSGVQGTEPNYGILLKAAFGAKSIATTEYDTIAASTVSLIKVGVGEGATFERGEALLIKDATNGYRIRPILSITGDDLTLGFQLPTGMAPGTGVNLGKAVLYKPADSGHPTMTVWDYRGNGGAVQMISGARVTELGIEANAGELINGSFSMEGVSFYFDPIEITASTDTLDFYDGTLTMAVTITNKMFKDPHELAAALQTGMNAQGSADTFTVVYLDASGKFKFSSNGATFSILWNTGAGTAQSIATKVGFTTAADSTGALTYTAPNALSLVAPHVPAFDNSNPLVAKYNEVLLGDSTDYGCFSTQSISFTLADEKADIPSICAESGKEGSLIVKREATIEMVANLPVYDADKFKRFRSNQNISFCFNFGTKSGGNWEAGKCGSLYLPVAKIESISLDDNNGLVVMNLTLKAFVESGKGEAYLNFV